MQQNVNTTSLSEVNFTIPCDVIIEIASIILQAEVHHQLSSIDEHKRELLITIHYNPELNIHRQALENIRDILNQYRQMIDQYERQFKIVFSFYKIITAAVNIKRGSIQSLKFIFKSI